MYNYANDNFEKYIKENYDIDNEKIRHKLNHTYHVVENARIIATYMDLDKENIDLAMVIALFHDIGRFKEAIDKNSFREDIIKYDHATLGVKLLFEDNLIRKFIKEDKYDNVIRTAILNHSKYILDTSNMADIEILHSKIIRNKDYINILFDRFDYKYEKERMFILRNKALYYLEKKV